MKLIIIITGTPGTGKTKVSEELGRLLRKKFKAKFKVLHLNAAILRHKLWSSVDKKRKSKNVDMRKLRRFVSYQIRKNPNIIIESHLAHYFKGDAVFVLRTGIDELRKRMEKRKWSERKIEENLESERLNLILGESLDMHGRECVEIDTTNKTPRMVAKAMIRKIGRPE